MIFEVEIDNIYYSKSGIPFQVLHIARHGQDCSWPMVVYKNLEPTIDAPINTIWTIAESIFLRRFYNRAECNEIQRNENNHAKR